MTAIASSSILSSRRLRLRRRVMPRPGRTRAYRSEGFAGFCGNSAAQKTSAADENAPARRLRPPLRPMLRPPTRPRPSLPRHRQAARPCRRQRRPRRGSHARRRSHDGHLPGSRSPCPIVIWPRSTRPGSLRMRAAPMQPARMQPPPAIRQRLCSPIRPPWSWQTCCHAAADRCPGHHAARRHHFAPSPDWKCNGRNHAGHPYRCDRQHGLHCAEPAGDGSRPAPQACRR
jgi:hypothetical protein